MRAPTGSGHKFARATYVQAAACVFLLAVAAALCVVGAQSAQDANSIGQQIELAQQKLNEVQEILNKLKDLFVQQQPQQQQYHAPAPILQQPNVAPQQQQQQRLPQVETFHSPPVSAREYAAPPVSQPETYVTAPTPQNAVAEPVSQKVHFTPHSAHLEYQEHIEQQIDHPDHGQASGSAEGDQDENDREQSEMYEDEDEHYEQEDEEEQEQQQPEGSDHSFVYERQDQDEAQTHAFSGPEEYGHEREHHFEAQTSPPPDHTRPVAVTVPSVSAPQQHQEPVNEAGQSIHVDNRIQGQTHGANSGEALAQQAQQAQQQQHQHQQLQQQQQQQQQHPAVYEVESQQVHQFEGPQPAALVTEVPAIRAPVSVHSAAQSSPTTPPSVSVVESRPDAISASADQSRQQMEQQQQQQQSAPAVTESPKPFGNWRALFAKPANMEGFKQTQPPQSQNPFAPVGEQSHELSGGGYGATPARSAAPALVNKDAENWAHQQQQQSEQRGQQPPVPRPQTSTAFSAPKMPNIRNPFSSNSQQPHQPQQRQHQEQGQHSLFGGNDREGLIDHQHRAQEPFVFSAQRDPSGDAPRRRHARKWRRYIRHPKQALTNYLHKRSEAHGEHQYGEQHHFGQLGGSERHSLMEGGATHPTVARDGRMHDLWDRLRSSSLVSGAAGKFQTHVTPRLKAVQQEASRALEHARESATSHRAKRRRLGDDELGGNDRATMRHGHAAPVADFGPPAQRVVPDMLGRLPQVPPVHLGENERPVQRPQAQQQQQQIKRDERTSSSATAPDGGAFRRQTSSSHMESSHSISTSTRR